MFWEEKIKTDSLEFRKFLAGQIALPREEWSDDFNQYVKKKHREFLAEPLDRSPEETMEWHFNRYLKSLDLKKDDLLGKKILDLGCGEGDFVKFCLGEGISDKVYGLDIQLEPEEINPGYRKYFFKGSFEEKLPIENLDYIFSVSAVGAQLSEKEEGTLRKAITFALLAIKHKGEIRIFPLRKAPPWSGLREIEFSWKKWTELLENMSTKALISYEIRPIDIRVAGNKPDVWLEQVLIIKRKY